MLPEQRGSLLLGGLNVGEVHSESVPPREEHPCCQGKVGTEPSAPQLERGGRLSPCPWSPTRVRLEPSLTTAMAAWIHSHLVRTPCCRGKGGLVTPCNGTPGPSLPPCTCPCCEIQAVLPHRGAGASFLMGSPLELPP